jgi:hypothetical protein
MHYEEHSVLFVADRELGSLDIYDSYPEYNFFIRNSVANTLIVNCQNVWLPELLRCVPRLVECEGTNDCGLHVIRNAARIVGLSPWKYTRTDVINELCRQRNLDVNK